MKAVYIFSVFSVFSVLSFALFYVYPADIFEAEITETDGSFTMELTLKNILFQEDLPPFVNKDKLLSVYPTVKGGLILFICIIGLPFMIAWRMTLRRNREEDQEEHSEEDMDLNE